MFLFVLSSPSKDWYCAHIWCSLRRYRARKFILQASRIVKQRIRIGFMIGQTVAIRN